MNRHQMSAPHAYQLAGLSEASWYYKREPDPGEDALRLRELTRLLR